MTNSNDGGSTQKGPERSAATTGDQPDTAGHTITGTGTIPADATVQTRDSEIAATVKDDADSHACEGCGQTFEEIGRLLDHDCEEDWDGPDPDDDSQRALADGGEPSEARRSSSELCSDGGVERIDTAEEFLEWSFEIRGEDCLVVTNDLSGDDDRPDRAAVWAEEPIDVPEGVAVETEREAEGTAPAVQGRDVEGWRKYELRLAEQALADGGVQQLEDVDTDAAPEREYEKMPQLRRDLLATIAELVAERDKLRFKAVHEAFAERHDVALPERTFEQHVTMLAHDGLVERGAYEGLNTTIAPTDVARDLVGDRDE